MSNQRTYADHALRQATEQYISSQVALGFKPAWMLTFHYWNPYQRGWRVAEPGIKWGYRVPNNHLTWAAVSADTAITRRRNDIIKVSSDARAVRNRLIRAVWGVNDLRKHNQQLSPMLVFHEKGKSELQYHTHILLCELPRPYNNIQSIQRIWNTAVAPTTRCISPTNSLHIRPVDSARIAGRYLTKEINCNETVVDWEASIPIILGHLGPESGGQ